MKVLGVRIPALVLALFAALAGYILAIRGVRLTPPAVSTAVA